MVADKIPSQKTRKLATGHHTEAYTGYIQKVLVDKKVCKLVTNMYVLSFINPRLHGVLDREQYQLGTLQNRNNSCSRGLRLPLL